LASSDADFYIRDATGNVLAVYHYDRKTSQLRWSEQHLYGSARLGMYLPEKLLTSVSTDSKQREVGYLGKQVFELSNHLGNVLATITDKKLQVSTNTTSTAYFEADVQTVQDYYAFGMQMPGRKLSGGYRYGFNGKENDNEVKGEGNQQDYGMRIYDGRIGKFLSVDPLTKAFSMLSPYQFAANSPIENIDLDGKEAENFFFGMKKKIMGISHLKMNNVNTLIGEIQQQSYTVNISDPIKDVHALYKQIATNINSIYGTDKGSFEFEKQQKLGDVSKGDFINIDQGLKGLDIAVKVVDVQKFKNNKPGVDGSHEGFSITFRTLEGHVEVGSISFMALQTTNPQTGAKSLEFNVSSTSQIDIGLATTILNGYARNAQQEVWQKVLRNVFKYTGGKVEDASQRIDKYKIKDFVPIDNDEKTIGHPESNSTPSTETKKLEIKK
jgi:RHS repeat-associated protein